MRPHQSIYYLGEVSVFVLLLMLGCTRNQELVGATTETTNGISGSVRNGDNTLAPNTVVKLFPDDYDPVSGGTLVGDYIDTTDAKGKFSFKRINPGSYAILARNRDSATSFRIGSIPVFQDSITMIYPETLGKSGSIATGFSTEDQVDSNSYVYIPGTDIFSTVRKDGSAFLGDIPAGAISKVILTTVGGAKNNVLRDKIIIVGGDTITIVHPLEKYVRKIIFNTTSTGAGVNSNINNFPVLIRLNAGNFDFSQARNDGRDLLFTGSTSKSLPIEIERWDAAANLAEIWVNIDTVFGNNSSQAITMYWGNPGASAQSSGGMVFDTANGFQGVWHMQENGNDPALDATVNHYNGTAYNMTDGSPISGNIGNARAFNGDSSYITMQNTAYSKLNFSEKGYYSISAWVYLDTSDGKSHCIVSKGYEQYYLRSTYISMSVPTMSPLWEFVEFSETVKWQASNTPASVKQWVLLTGIRQGSKQLLYCNGSLVDSTVDVWNNAVSRNTTNDLTIGRFAKAVTVPISEGYCYFKGGIDEVRIVSTAQSPDWVKLCYMNQRSDDRLVVLK